MLNNLQTYALVAKMKLRQLFSDEKGEVNVVAIVVLIGIAILTAVIFRDQIGNFVTTLFGQLETNAIDAINGGGGD